MDFTETNISSLWITSVVPILAFILSVIVLLTNRYFSKKNIKISTMQAIFKTVAEKANDCNRLWEHKDSEFSIFAGPPPIDAKHNVVSELIISIEVIEKSFYLFGEDIIGHKDDFYYLFWKQLRTGLREWLRQEAPKIADSLNKTDYSKQIRDIHEKFLQYFEPT
jgi:hypothetical protein